jgi:predicted kinase
MPTLHLLHGLPGSGKTGLAKKLAGELPAVRFTPDEWMVTLHGINPPEAVFRPQHEKIMALIWSHVARVLETGADVVLDVGFWSRASRDDARRRAGALGVECRFYSLNCPIDEARRRVLARTAKMPPGELEISEPTFEFLARQMEPMGADEPHIVVEPAAPEASS